MNPTSLHKAADIRKLLFQIFQKGCAAVACHTNHCAVHMKIPVFSLQFRSDCRFFIECRVQTHTREARKNRDPVFGVRINSRHGFPFQTSGLMRASVSVNTRISAASQLQISVISLNCFFRCSRATFHVAIFMLIFLTYLIAGSTTPFAAKAAARSRQVPQRPQGFSPPS